MQLAVSLPVEGLPPRETAGCVQRCLGLGYTAVWAGEVNGPDFASLLGAVAATSDVDLGVAVAPAQTRSPWLLAATAATLSHLSDGRFTLGIGSSSETIIEEWSGLPFERPLTRVRETVEVVRTILSGERTAYDGELVRSHGYRLFLPPPKPVPIVLGALNPRSLRQAGALGDGVCLNQLGPQHVPRALHEVREGAAGAGRSLDGFRVLARLFCWVVDDVPAARASARRLFAPYAAVTAYNRFFRWLGFVAEMDAVEEALRRGDRAAAAAALSDDLIDALAVIGSEDEVTARVAAYVDAGIDLPVIACLGRGPQEADRVLRTVSRLVR